MAFPNKAGTATSKETGNQTSHTVTLPTPVGAGDLVVVKVALDSFDEANSFTWPAPWVEIFDVEHPGGNIVSVTAGYLIAAGSETTVIVTSTHSDHSTHIAYRFDDWHGTTPPEGATATGSSQTPDPPSLNPTGWDIEDTFWIAGIAVDRPTDSHPTTADPTNYVNPVDSVDDVSSGVFCRTAERELNAASEDPATYTLTASEDWIAWTIGVPPPAGVSNTDRTPTIGAVSVAGVAVDHMDLGMAVPVVEAID